MQKTVLGMLLAAGLLVSGAAANAAQITGTAPIVFSGNNMTSDFGATIGPNHQGDTFAEEFTFSLPSAFDVASAVISITLGQDHLNINNFTLTNFDNSKTFTGTGAFNGSVQSWQLSASGLAAGSYTLTVLGSVIGQQGGSFGGNINISPVPEASTTAMMLGGLALVGFAATRRRRNKDAAPSLGMFAA